MVADLLEVREQGQDAPTALDARGGGVQLLIHLLDAVLVELRLLATEGGEDLHLVLLWQVLDDALVTLEAAEDKGPDALAQLVGGVGIAVLLDGIGEALLELRLAAQVARQARVHDGPQLREAVLDGGACERQAEGAVQLADGLGLGRAGVLDGLGLVHHHHAPGTGGEGVLLAAHHAVGGEHQGVGLEGLGQTVPVVAVVHKDRHGGRKLGQLPLPVPQQGGRADQQGGGTELGAVFLTVEQ